jgi:hypothetical protein
MLPGLFTAKKVTYHRRGQTFVSDQAMLDRVAQVDEFFCHWHRKQGFGVPDYTLSAGNLGYRTQSGGDGIPPLKLNL